MFVSVKVWFKTEEHETAKRECDRLGIPYKNEENEELDNGEVIINTDHITRVNKIDFDDEEGSIIWLNEKEGETAAIRTPHPYERWKEILAPKAL